MCALLWSDEVSALLPLIIVFIANKQTCMHFLCYAMKRELSCSCFRSRKIQLYIRRWLINVIIDSNENHPYNAMTQFILIIMNWIKWFYSSLQAVIENPLKAAYSFILNCLMIDLGKFYDFANISCEINLSFHSN